MAKSKKSKPSFEPAAGQTPDAGAAGWVYRSDAAAQEAPADAPRAPRARKSAPEVKAEATTAAPPPAAAATDRAVAAGRIVDRYAKYSAAAGLVPVPVVDVAAIAAVQTAMLSALTAHYQVPYEPDRGKMLVATMMGGLMPALAGHQVLKVAGPLAGMIGVAGLAMTATAAVGRLFIGHFESGGTLLDFDAERSRQQLATAVSRP
jgi:uncharacterized protein (DUF697 family)